MLQHLLAYWMSPRAVERVMFIGTVAATMLAFAFIAAIVWFA